jgi:hypothetical protein
MYAHVMTYRLGSDDETRADMDYAAREEGAVVMDQTARTIASWWHSPARHTAPLLALSQGRPFDTVELREVIGREVEDPADSDALLAWLDTLEVILSDPA